MRYIDNVRFAFNDLDNNFYLVKINKYGEPTQQRMIADSEINMILNFIKYFNTHFEFKDIMKEEKSNEKNN